MRTGDPLPTMSPSTSVSKRSSSLDQSLLVGDLDATRLTRVGEREVLRGDLNGVGEPPGVDVGRLGRSALELGAEAAEDSGSLDLDERKWRGSESWLEENSERSGPAV